MTCFRVASASAPRVTGGGGGAGLFGVERQHQPFVEFSPSERDRANLMSSVGTGLGNSRAPSRRRRRRIRSAAALSGSRRRRSRVSRLRVVNGRVSFRLPGFSGVQRVGASQLVRFVPVTKLRQAAKRFLGKGGRKVRRKRKRGRRAAAGRRKKRRKGRRRRRSGRRLTRRRRRRRRRRLRRRV